MATTQTPTTVTTRCGCRVIRNHDGSLNVIDKRGTLHIVGVTNLFGDWRVKTGTLADTMRQAGCPCPDECADNSVYYLNLADGIYDKAVAS